MLRWMGKSRKKMNAYKAKRKKKKTMREERYESNRAVTDKERLLS